MNYKEFHENKRSTSDKMLETTPPLDGMHRGGHHQSIVFVQPAFHVLNHLEITTTIVVGAFC